MSVPKHFRFTLRGVFTNTPEIWSMGFHMSKTVALGDDTQLGDIDESAVTAAIATWFGRGYIAGNVLLTDWRAYDIGTDGKMVGNGPLLHDASGDAIHGTGAVKYPTQIALVITLKANNRGPAQYGRMFMPGPVMDLQTDARISDAVAGEVGDFTGLFLKDVSDAIDAVDLNQTSGVNISSHGGGGAGTLQVIDHVEVGRTLDTLRTRRNQLVEDRHVSGHLDW